MDNGEYRRHAHAMLRLIASVLEPERPAVILPADIELETLHSIARRHSLAALTYLGLKKAGIMSAGLRESAAQAKRRSVILSSELKALEAAFTEKRIHFMPLKGMILRSLYPGTGSREMSDIDLWYDRAQRDRVREVMLELGYTPAKKQAPNHDVYSKPPWLIVEAHHDLFDGEVYRTFYDYYKDKTYASSDENEYLCRMTPGEMYVYLISHAYIHYISAGTGLRTLIDLRLFRRRYKAETDSEAVVSELNALGTADFEAETRRLSERMFDPDELTAEESKLLDRYIFSAVHGTDRIFLQNRINRGLEAAEHGKLSYLKARLNVTDQDVKRHPFFSRHPKMVWMLRVARPFKAAAKPKRVFRELKLLRETEANADRDKKQEP